MTPEKILRIENEKINNKYPDLFKKKSQSIISVPTD